MRADIGSLAGEWAMPGTRSLLYGPGALERAVATVLRPAGRRVFVVASPFVEESVGLLREELGSAFAGVATDITMHVGMPSVLATVEAAREAGADALVSIGGGTAIDGAKAVSMCLGCDVRSADELVSYRTHRGTDGATGRAVTAELPPHVSVPTTLAGAEATTMFGVTDPVTREKLVFSDPRYGVRTVVLDPVVAQGTPDWLWASSGMRAVDHAVEGVLSSRHAPFHDATALEGLRLLRGELVASAADPHDVAARVACQIGAWLTTCVIGTVGVGLSHAIGHQLAPRFDMAHGVTSAVMLPHVMDFNREVTGRRLARVAEAMGCLEPTPIAAVTAVAEFAAALEPLGVPTTLSAAGADWDGLEQVATHVMTDHTAATNPQPVTRDDIMDLFARAWR